MAYRVTYTSQAYADLDAATAWIAKESPSKASRWYFGFKKAILSLAENPERCRKAVESSLFPFEVREFLYGRQRSYRAIFTIRDDEVVILAIRHTARDYLQPDDV